MHPADKSLAAVIEEARSIFLSGLQAVDPRPAVHRRCRRENDQLIVDDAVYDLAAKKHIYVIGAGKASARMGAALEEILDGRITGGLISVKYGYTEPLQTITVAEGGHPLPDESGQRNARRIMDLAQAAGPDDLVICLISGGGSALLPLPAEGLLLADKQETMRALLACGASIGEINTLRKHLSAIKGGRLARAIYPAALLCLVISDVIGDDLATIASGPTVPDKTTFSDCRDIIDKYDLTEKLPSSVTAHITAGRKGDRPETPGPEDEAFTNTRTIICADSRQAVGAAEKKAVDLGYNTMLLSTLIEGDTREAARFHTAIAREILLSGRPVPKPACILSGGETTVTLQGQGKGGRNQEFCLAAVEAIAGRESIVILSGGTDGTDGPTDAAGAFVHHRTAQMAAEKGLSPATYLADNDSYSFFEKTGGLLITGPTNTNVMDLRIMLIF